MIEARITKNEKCLIYHWDSQLLTSLSPKKQQRKLCKDALNQEHVPRTIID